MNKVIIEHVNTMEKIEGKLNKAFEDGYQMNFSEAVGDNYIVYLFKCTCGKKKCECGCC
jgi:hypothetical protein